LREITRRQFNRLTVFGLGALGIGSNSSIFSCSKSQKPNVIFILADQWRVQDTGYAGNPDVKTPNLDRFAERSFNFSNAVSGCPVCSPYRASLLTGQYWLTHGIFYNDKPLNPEVTSIAKVYRKQGYKTAYIGKWHLNGHPKGGTTKEGRNAPIPRERRQGFDFWRVRECTHDYNNSFYYDENNKKHFWEGYDTIAQTRTAQGYIRDIANKDPFLLFLSWGPPHAPYLTAPEKYQNMFDKDKIKLRPNVPEKFSEKARESIAGYYAHIAALNDCMGDILHTLKECNIEENTILVFTSDHGDMLYSHGQTKKQRPWDESIRVPFLLSFPKIHGNTGKEIYMPINTPDIMPTLLGLSGIPIPDSVEGTDYSDVLRGTKSEENEAAFLTLPVPFHQWGYRVGGREYRGIRTKRYTYVKDLKGPWLLYDNKDDPYQLNNLCNNPEFAQIQQKLDFILKKKLQERNDEFLPGPEYMKKWDYDWDKNDGPRIAF